MAEIVNFRKLRVEWNVTIRENVPVGYAFDLIRGNCLLVTMFCPSWDQVDSLRKQAEWAIENREYPRTETELF